jgi:hypothetical protein
MPTYNGVSYRILTSVAQSNASHCIRISSASDGSSVKNSRPTDPS